MAKKQEDTRIQSAEHDALLLAINQCIAAVRNKMDVLNVLLPELKAAFQTNDIFICQLANAGATLVPFLRTADNARKSNDAYIGI